MSGENNNKLFCWEQVMGVNPLFRLSHLFADPAVKERLVPLYALFAAIEQVCTTVSEEAVAVRKLAWWRAALLDPVGTAAEHPIIAELSRTGAISLMPGDQISRLLDVAGYRIEAPSIPGLAELQALCQMAGEPQVELERSVCGSGPGKGGLQGLAVRRGLLQLVREDLGAAWWVPLDQLAKHGVSRASLASGKGSEPVTLIVRDMLQMESLQKPTKSGDYSDISFFKQTDRHLLVFDALTRRKLESTKFSSYIKWKESLFQLRAGDLFSCWRAASRFNRQK